MSAAQPARQTTAKRCPRCGGTQIKTWEVGSLPRAMCKECKHKWTLFVPEWMQKAEEKERKRWK
jgi:transposase-like protein